MRLQGKSTPDALHAHAAQATMFGHGTDTPMGRLTRGGLQGQRDYTLNLCVGKGSWRPRTHLIKQSIETLDDKPAAPLTDALFGQVHLLSYRSVGFAGRTKQYDTSTLCQGLSRLGTSCPSLQGLTFFSAQDQRRNRTSSAHLNLLFYIPDVSVSKLLNDFLDRTLGPRSLQRFAPYYLSRLRKRRRH